MSGTRQVVNRGDIAFAVRDADGVVHLSTVMADLDPVALWGRFEFRAPLPDAAARYWWARGQRDRGAAIVAVRCEVLGEVDITEGHVFQTSREE